MTKYGHRGRGSVGRAISGSRRLRINLEFRKKQLEQQKNSRRKNRKHILKYKRKYTNLLNEFRNKRCILCEKLLDYRAKGDYCRGCLLSNLILLRSKNKKNKK